MADDEVEEEDGQEYVFGIPVPSLDEDVQPLECMVLVKGIRMEDGSPTMTTIGSEGITPWEAVGMMVTEIERIKFMTVYASVSQQAEDEEE